MQVRTNLGAVYLDRQKIIDSIMKEAKVLSLHPGAVQLFADKVADNVEKWAAKRSAITEKDLDLRIAKELEQYHSDLAYIFKNRGKII